MIKPIFNLTPEEQEIEDAIERGEYTEIPNMQEEIERFKLIAKNTLAKNKTITIRLSERNLMHVKAAAAREGLSYQTFIASLIHKNT
jgi:predicted DNA binding CopG/RHH family protein